LPEARLGGSFAALKAHIFFEKFDWDALLDKKLKPPFVPPQNKFLSDADIKKAESSGKKAIEHIEADLKGHFKKYHPEKAKDKNWDADFWEHIYTFGYLSFSILSLKYFG